MSDNKRRKYARDEQMLPDWVFEKKIDEKENKMKKTAVDFIVEQLDVLHRERKENLIDAETFFKHKAVLIAQAKEMEKQQAEKKIVDTANKILTAKEYIRTNLTDFWEGGKAQYTEEDVVKAMIEFARLHVEAASK